LNENPSIAIIGYGGPPIYVQPDWTTSGEEQIVKLIPDSLRLNCAGSGWVNESFEILLAKNPESEMMWMGRIKLYGPDGSEQYLRDQ
jgi:hypothetical protein